MSPPAPSTSIRAHLCGRCHSVNLHISHNGSNLAPIEKALLKSFGIDERNYSHSLFWHFRTEHCQVQRPFADLARVAVCAPEVLRRESLRVHVCRMVKVVPGPDCLAVGGGVVGGLAAGLAVAGGGGAGGAGTVPMSVAGGSGGVLGSGADLSGGQARTNQRGGETGLPAGEEGASPGDKTTVGQERVVSEGETAVASADAATTGRATTASNAKSTAPGGSAEVIDDDAESDEDAGEPADRRRNRAAQPESSGTIATSGSSKIAESTSQSAADNSSEPPSPKHSPPPSVASATVADEVALRIEWSQDTCQQLGLVPHTFSNIRTQLDTSLVDVRERIRDEIVRFLRKFPQLRDHFRDTIAIRYRAVVNIHSGGHDVVDLEDLSYGGRFTAVSDLFVDPSMAPRSVNVRITLFLDDGSDSSPAAKKRKMSKVSPETLDFDQPVQSTQDDVNPRRNFIRLGEVSEREIIDSDDIAEEFPILAEIDRQQRTLLFLWGTRAWDFDDFCIGGFELCKKALRFSQRLLWFDRYHGVKSKSQLQERISARVTTDQRMPFLPPLTFNAFDPDEYDPPFGTGVINKYGVVVVIRFVSHLPKAENERLAFHKNFQLVVGDPDDYESIAKEVKTELENADETKRLFRAEYQDRWQLQLWAMPHEPAPRTLFRFEPAGSDGPSLVKRFMSSRMLRRGQPGCKLYMEAHLWEVGDDDEQLVQHHAGIGSGHASGPCDLDGAEDAWLDGSSAPTRQGRATAKKRKLTRAEGAKKVHSTHAEKHASTLAVSHDNPEDASDHASSASDGDELRVAAAREQYRLVEDERQLRLAMEASEREVLEGLPRDDSLLWDALSTEDMVGAGNVAADCGSKESGDDDDGSGDRDVHGQNDETHHEDRDSPASLDEVDHTGAVRVEDEQSFSGTSSSKQRDGSRADIRDGEVGEDGDDDDDDESSWLVHVPASLRAEQRRQ
ncbi:hypothetical protein LTR82_015428 [Friedmanniomyces endolithicus]|uniref:Uncharacterized protein n=1 Tax=Friedmanniomyces endolithicus TaxID=329885 RepID=A0AAN6F894_9PEZI|nr:hypothetical protein LTR82_015428 [Friedmanniomyces endolithicus]